jgi:hypothetical protein
LILGTRRLSISRILGANEERHTVIRAEKHGEEKEHSDILEHVEELLEFLLGTNSSLELDDGTISSDDLVLGCQHLFFTLSEEKRTRGKEKPRSDNRSLGVSRSSYRDKVSTYKHDDQERLYVSDVSSNQSRIPTK